LPARAVRLSVSGTSNRLYVLISRQVVLQAKLLIILTSLVASVKETHQEPLEIRNFLDAPTRLCHQSTSL
jgi:hypothetical protein